MISIFKQIILDFYKSDIPQPDPREFILPEMKEPVRKAFIFLGMRRTGKTWAMFWQMQKLLRKGINKKRLLYINFEDDRLISMDHRDFQAILDAYFSLYPDLSEAKDVHFFFDEIHGIGGWEKFIRRLLDQEKMNIYISGSSARMLGKEIANSLRGRTVLQEIFPYSFREFLGSNNVHYEKPFSTREKAVISHFKEEYFVYGGFPEAVLLDKHFHRELLQGYIDVVIYRDIIERYNLTNIHIVRNLIAFCLQNLTSPVSINKIYHRFKSTGKSIGKNYLYNLMNYFQDAFCIFSIPIFSFSHEKQTVNPKKIYAVDQGFITAYSIKPEFEASTRFENAVFCELRRKTDEIYYYKTHNGKEVDFIIRKKNGIKELYQACISLSGENTFKREVSALIQGMKELDLSTGFIITKEEKKEIDTDSGIIRVIPFDDWVTE